MRPRAVFGHGIWLNEGELQVLHQTGSAIAHCPTSNFFLGSGFFNIQRAMQSERPVRVGLGTDLGAGTSFSILATLNEAYKAAQLNSYALSAGHAYYLATRGTAHAIYLEDRIGSIAPGLEADIVVLDMKSTPIIEYRYGMLLLSQIIIAIGSCTGFVGAGYVGGQWFGMAKFSFMFGLVQVVAALTSAFSVNILEAVLAHVTWRSLFNVYGLLGIVLFVLGALYIRNPHPVAGGMSQGIGEFFTSVVKGMVEVAKIGHVWIASLIGAAQFGVCSRLACLDAEAAQGMAEPIDAASPTAPV